MSEEKENIQLYKDDWALTLMEKGVIIRLQIGRWSGTSTLRPEELGLFYNTPEIKEFVSRYLFLGSERLLPPEILNEIVKIERKARVNLDLYSYDTLWGKFVPFTAFSTWKDQNDKIKIEYMEMAKSLYERYDEIIDIVKENYKKMANDVWGRIYPNDKNGATSGFIEDFTSKIVKKIPPPEDIISSFKYNITYFSIPLPSFLHEDIKKAQKIQNETEIENKKSEEEKRNIRIKSDIEIETHRQIMNEYQSRKRELIDSFLDSTVKALRINIGEICENIKISMIQSENLKIKKTNSDKIRKIIENVRILNFQNDVEINEIIKSLEEELMKFKDERDNELILRQLQKVVDISKKEFIPKDINPIINYLDA